MKSPSLRPWRALRTLAFALMAIGVALRAQAHEPNISAMFLNATDDNVSVRLNYKTVDDDGNLGTEEIAESKIRDLGANWISISEKPGAPFHSANLPAGELSPAGQQGMVTWRTTIPFKPTGTWTLRLNQVYRLGAAHGEYITVKNLEGEVVAEGLLTDNTMELTIKWDASSPGEAAGGEAAAAAAAPAAKNQPVNYKEEFTRFLKVGVIHILTGYDHLLYLAGLLLGCKGFRSLLGVITSFTIAHSITLALAATHTVILPARLIEPLIAASIVFVAVENVWLRGRPPKRRWIVAFAFGLVHGFGFAETLTELGMSHEILTLLTALFGFNCGVEIGQLTVVVPTVPLLLWARRYRNWGKWYEPGLSLCIALMGSYWLVTRVLGIGVE
jgi:hydrogenase/urease accessory protein HupE